MSSLVINEIFFSIQGESTHAGKPCVFVRLTACDLRCSWCDSEYTFYEGTKRTLDSILDEVRGYGCDLVEVAPDLDPSGLTTLTGITLMWELLCVLATAVARR